METPHTPQYAAVLWLPGDRHLRRRLRLRRLVTTRQYLGYRRPVLHPLSYGAQPPFIKYKGPELKKSLGKNGILLIQSSMPEALFNQHILMGDMRSLKRWPWYYQEFVLSKFFSCVKVFFIDNQFITLASQSYVSINRIIKKLGREAIPYSYFKQKQ